MLNGVSEDLVALRSCNLGCFHLHRLDQSTTQFGQVEPAVIHFGGVVGS